MNNAIEARRLLRNCRSGALATLSARLDGHPFASVVAFMSDYDASPILLVSGMAEHTKNIACDARVSLMVQERITDIQAAPRLTIAGICTRIDPDASLRDRYLRLFPAAADYLALDFKFHRIDPTAIRYIGGLGNIQWVSPQTFADAGGVDASVEREWRQRWNATPALAALGCIVALDCDGADVARDGTIQRIAFNPSLHNPPALDAALNDLRRRAFQ